MAWSLYRWVWEVESPVHIGLAPAGMLNRTRLYVPARTLWGALTAELARRRAGDKGFPDYGGVGEELRKRTHLSYLFPAEQVGGQWKAWLPGFHKERGLVWEREDGRKEGDREFRRHLLTTRPGTAIEPESDSASEGTLRELELISPYWQRDSSQLSRVGFVGYVFCQDDSLKKELEEIRLLWIGGDTRYGLGKLSRRTPLEEAKDLFGARVTGFGKIQTERLLAHMPVDAKAHKGLKGAWELFRGWDSTNDASLTIPQLAWTPGSLSENGPLEVYLRHDGLWSLSLG